MAFRAGKVLGTFEKRAPGFDFLNTSASCGLSHGLFVSRNSDSTFHGGAFSAVTESDVCLSLNCYAAICFELYAINLISEKKKNAWIY